jgi:hypothetical protein
MTTATTTLFSQSNVAALMITGKAPRFEITRGGTVQQTFPATRSWKSEQKRAVEAALALLADQPAAKLAALLRDLGHPLRAEGEPVTAQAATLTLVTTDAGGLRIIVQGGKNAQARAALRIAVRESLEAVGGWFADSVQDGLAVAQGARFTPVAHTAEPPVVTDAA